MPAKNNSGSFSDEERKAIQDRAKELRAEERASKKREVGEQLVLDAIAKMPEPDKGLASKIHEIVTRVAPQLWPKTFYGFPAYSIEGKDVVCFFQFASKFGSRYGTLTFDTASKLDDGNMWPVSYAVIKITAAEEQKIVELVKKAVE